MRRVETKIQNFKCLLLFKKTSKICLFFLYYIYVSLLYEISEIYIFFSLLISWIQTIGNIWCHALLLYFCYWYYLSTLFLVFLYNSCTIKSRYCETIIHLIKTMQNTFYKFSCRSIMQWEYYCVNCYNVDCYSLRMIHIGSRIFITTFQFIDCKWEVMWCRTADATPYSTLLHQQNMQIPVVSGTETTCRSVRHSSLDCPVSNFSRIHHFPMAF